MQLLCWRTTASRAYVARKKSKVGIREIDWLLSVTDHIVELVPSQQKSKDGSNMEIMVTRQRNDIHMNIPALRKLDAMLLDIRGTSLKEVTTSTGHRLEKGWRKNAEDTNAIDDSV
ncbi:hypothetical protein D5086_001683 [Populus alba]|uniref:Uncharacterized protein n=1 Tax=Populus alba TaxID=43335 RepID=A0ACC4CZV4_POPAL